MEKCPALSPPSRSANTAGASGPGWHSHVSLASGVSSATERSLASIEMRSMGGACWPYNQLRRSSSRNASMVATSSVSSMRYSASVSPSPTFTPRSGPVSRANAFSSVTSSPTNTAAVAPA